MSSYTEMLAHMDYVMATCAVLAKVPLMQEAQPTVVWLNQEAERVVRQVLSQASSPKQMTSWLRVAKRKSDALRDNLTVVERDSVEPATEEENILFICSVMTQMLEDISTIANQKAYVPDMLAAAYTIESLVPTRKKQQIQYDNVYPDAQKFLDQVYQQHRTV